MTVLRIVADIETADLSAGDSFYRGILGLDVLMDLGFIKTYGSRVTTTVQLSVMTEGGSGTPVPSLSIEVDDLDEVLARVQAANLPLEYGPVIEPWGVRRFFVHDPFGRLINVLERGR